MSAWLAVLLGILEGVTEYLPVSSTGHLVLASRLFGLEGDAIDAFDVVIQLGAILAVLVHYRRLLYGHAMGLASRRADSVRLLLALVIGFLPTAVTGLLLRKIIKRALFNPTSIALALVVGGVVMIAVEVWAKRRERAGVSALDGLEHVTPRRALAIGVGQCISMWPGSSRSMCTIVAGQLAGLGTATAAEFSFLLGLPTLGAAAVYEAYKSRHELAGLGGLNVLLGLTVSFLVAWAVIAGFVAYLKKRGLAPFAVYRILLGGAILLVFLR